MWLPWPGRPQLGTLSSARKVAIANVSSALLLPPHSISHACLQLFEEAGTDLAQALTVKEAIAKKKAAMCPDVAKALARVSGGLYIGGWRFSRRRCPAAALLCCLLRVKPGQKPPLCGGRGGNPLACDAPSPQPPTPPSLPSVQSPPPTTTPSLPWWLPGWLRPPLSLWA